MENRSAYVTLLAVSPECQKMGIGVELMKAALNLAKSRGMKSVKLEVKKENLRAIRLYERLGFARICDAGDNSIYMINYLDEN
jgi:ribosomal-protein-alanine N-acetyltransferase